MIAAAIRQKLTLSLTFLVLATITMASARAEPSEDLRKKVLDAWQKRQDQVESATFKMRSTVVLTKRELQRRENPLLSFDGKEPNPKQTHKEDKTLTEFYEVAFHGSKLKFAMNFDKDAPEIAKTVNRNMSMLYVTNGEDYRSLESFPDNEVRSGVIQNADQFLVFRIADIWPIFQAFRASSPPHAQQVDSLKVVDGEHQIGGRHVVVLKQHKEGALAFRAQYWTDPSRDYVVLRYQTMVDENQVGSQTDIEYDQDKSGNWVPVKWAMTSFDPDGNRRQSSEFQVVEYEINPELPESLFELEFEPGVEVFDKRNGVRNANVWVVKEDGTKEMKRGVDPDK